MNELIAVHYSSDRQTVLGQDLHKMLEVDSNYTTWFRQMCEYGFLENIDFMICFPNLESELRGEKNKQDHQITIDMARALQIKQIKVNKNIKTMFMMYILSKKE